MLSYYQMGPALPGRGSHGVPDEAHGGEEEVKKIYKEPVSGRLIAPWQGGPTGVSLRSGTFTSAAKRLSYAPEKGDIPLSHSRVTAGSLLFAAREDIHVPGTPSAFGSKFPKRDVEG